MTTLLIEAPCFGKARLLYTYVYMKRSIRLEKYFQLRKNIFNMIRFWQSTRNVIMNELHSVFAIHKATFSYLSVVLVPVSPSDCKDSSSICIPSIWARILSICTVSSRAYGIVRMIMTRSRRSNGIPCGETISVPLQENRYVRQIHTV